MAFLQGGIVRLQTSPDQATLARCGVPEELQLAGNYYAIEESGTRYAVPAEIVIDNELYSFDTEGRAVAKSVTFAPEASIRAGNRVLIKGHCHVVGVVALGNNVEIGSHVDLTSASLGNSTMIGNNVRIGENFTGEPGVRIGHGTVIGTGVSVGRETSIGTGVTPEKYRKFTEDTSFKVIKRAPIGVTIGSGVHIAEKVTVSDGAVIGERVILEKGVAVGKARVRAGAHLLPHATVADGRRIRKGRVLALLK